MYGLHGFCWKTVNVFACRRNWGWKQIHRQADVFKKRCTFTFYASLRISIFKRKPSKPGIHDMGNISTPLRPDLLLPPRSVTWIDFAASVLDSLHLGLGTFGAKLCSRGTRIVSSWQITH